MTVMSTPLREQYEQVLRSYTGPGGPSRYDSPEKAKEARKLYMRAYASIWQASPKGRALGRAKDHNHRRSGDPRYSCPPGVSRHIRDLLEDKEGKCFYCMKLLEDIKSRVIDHYIPVAKGGEHSPYNLVLACWECNSIKSDMWPDDFIKLMGYYAQP